MNFKSYGVIILTNDTINCFLVVRISWMLIMYFDFIPCYLLEVTHRVMIGYNLKCSKVIE